MALRWLRPDPAKACLSLVVIGLGLILTLVESHHSWGKADPRVVAGVVLDTDGRPVDGAEVWAEPGGFQDLSGRDGSFRFRVPSNSELVLRAAPDESSRTLPDLVRVPVKGGETKIVLTVPAGGRIRFRLDPLPHTPFKVRAELRTAAGASLRCGYLRASGLMSLASLPPGPLTLDVTDETTGATAHLEGLHPASQEVLVRLSSP